MAEEGGISKEDLAKQKLLEELTCVVCTDIHEDPRLLPCQHTYCATPTCLGGLLKTAKNNSIFCPQCRSQVAVQGTNMDIFPKDFKMNRLMEIYEVLVSDMCKVHTTKELTMYCEHCDAVLCTDCCKDHNRHQKGSVKEIATKYREEITKTLVDLKAKVDDKKYRKASWNLYIHEVQRTLETVEQNYRELKTQTEERFDAMITFLQDQKESLLSRLDEELLPKIGKARAIKEEQSKALKEVKEMLEIGKTVTETQNDIKFLAQQKELTEQLQQVKNTTIKKIETFLSPFALYEVRLPDEEHFERELQKNISFLKPITAAMVSADSRSLDSAQVNKKTIVPLTIKQYDSDHVTTKTDIIDYDLQLFCMNSRTVEGMTVEETSPFTRNIVITPVVRGYHRLSVQVNHTYIPGSRFNFMVKAEYGPVVKEFDCVKPTGAASAYMGAYLLDEGKKGATVIKNNPPTIEEGEFVYLGEDHLSSIAVETFSSMYISTGETHKVLKYSNKGKLLKSVGSFGSGPQDFNTPKGLAHSNNKLYVCDSGNNRVKVLDSDLKLIKIITGDEKGESFQSPLDIASYDGGYYDRQLIIAEKSRIRIIDLERHTKKAKMFGEGKLVDVVSVARFKESIFVADAGRRCISMFSLNGVFLKDFGEESLENPRGLAVDSDGYVYVSSGNKLLVF